MKNLITGKFCTEIRHWALPVGVGAALAVSNGIAVGTAVGAGLWLLVAFSRR